MGYTASGNQPNVPQLNATLPQILDLDLTLIYTQLTSIYFNTVFHFMLNLAKLVSIVVSSS